MLTLVHVGCQALVEWLEGAASRWSWGLSWWLLWFSPGQARHHLSRVLAPVFLTLWPLHHDAAAAAVGG